MRAGEATVVSSSILSYKSVQSKRGPKLHLRKLSRNNFGKLADGTAVEAIGLTNSTGMSVCIISFGASIQAVEVADRDGSFADVTAGYRTLDEYISQPQFFGSTVGRVANRLKDARFSLGGKDYVVPANDGRNSLHGGSQGFDKVNWEVVDCDEDDLSVTLRYVSKDGDQGYPGTLTTLAKYSLTDDNMLTVEYRATTDAPTIVNLSNHAYWNLAGEGSQYDAMDHLLTIHADMFLPVDAELIPTGERRNVTGSAFDFRTPKAIHSDVRNAGDEQIGFGRGYDHNWIISDRISDAPRPMAHLEDPHSGRTMTLFSNQPGLQFYSGNFFDGSTSGKAGKFYRMGDAIALEPQQFPDTPNHPAFGSLDLHPGQTYSNIISWRFGVAPKKDTP
ncbi:MAG: galactose mutarotase [Sphingomonadaceae bacterium]|nr:galactose mutarotase [Sphingomonadaceae bacterium]